MPTRRPRLAPLLAAALAAVGAVALAPPVAAEVIPGSVPFAETTAGLAVSGTYTPLVGDFDDASPTDDVFWYAPGPGTDHIWSSVGDGTFTSQPSPQPVNGTYTPIVGDFAGDERDDILWYAPGPGGDSLWTATGAGFTSQAVTVNGTYMPVVLDDAVGRDDVLWARPGGGVGSTWAFAGDGSHTSRSFTSPAGARPLVGRFNDGPCADVFWYAPGAASDSLWLLDCEGDDLLRVGQSVFGTYQPVVQRFGPDERDDILWFGSGTTTTLWRSDGDSTWTSSSVDLGVTGQPFSLGSGSAYVRVDGGPDRIVFPDGVALLSIELDSTDLPASHRPVVGAFTDGGGVHDVLWYAPGPGVERLLVFLPSLI